MNIQVTYRSRTFDIPLTALVWRDDTAYAPIDIGQRGQVFTHYVKQPNLTRMLYTVEPPPKALTVIMPVSAAKSITHTNVTVLAFKDVSLYHESMAA